MREKLSNTILYLLRGCHPGHPSLSSLLKMVWFADYWHYREHLSTITGADYVALPRGPVVDGYKELLDSLEATGVLSRKDAPVYGHPEQPKQEYFPMKGPDESLFLQTELEVLDTVIERCGHKTGADLSALTHRDGPWQFVWSANNPGRRIPRIAFRWLDNLPDEKDLAVARNLVAEPSVMKLVGTLNAAA